MSKDWMSVRIPSELADEIRQEAKSRGTTITKVVEDRLSVKVVDVTDPVPSPSGAMHYKTSAVPLVEGCQHPKERQRQAATGVICLDCRIVRKKSEV